MKTRQTAPLHFRPPWACLLLYLSVLLLYMSSNMRNQGEHIRDTVDNSCLRQKKKQTFVWRVPLEFHWKEEYQQIQAENCWRGRRRYQLMSHSNTLWHAGFMQNTLCSAIMLNVLKVNFSLFLRMTIHNVLQYFSEMKSVVNLIALEIIWYDTWFLWINIENY